MWVATNSAGVSVRVTYASVSARIQLTHPIDRKRLADGSLVLGDWTVRRVP